MVFVPDYEGKNFRGTVLRIERSSVHDGDGYRTVVFLKGCPLRCLWCSTPESQRFEIEEAAGKRYGKLMSVEDVLREVRKDIPFYFHSGGGLTLSGGELLAQPEFSLYLLKQARWEGIQTAVETSFFAPWESIEPILACTDLAFVDMKAGSAALHEKCCGAGNERILENLLRTNELEQPLRLVIRIPIIPGVNDSREELAGIGAFCARLTHLEKVQLLPYHRLGTATYEKLGRPYTLEKLLPPTPEHMEDCRNVIRKFVNNVI